MANTPRLKQINGETSGSIVFIGANEQGAEDNNHLFWDITNKTLVIGENTPPISTKLFLRGTTSDSSEHLFAGYDASGTSRFRIRNDGLVQLGTTGSLNSGVGGAYHVRNFIGNHASTSSANEIETGLSQRITFQPTSNSTVRGSASRFSALKYGSNKIKLMYGVVAEGMNLGEANFDANSLSGIYGLLAISRNQYGGATDINIGSMFAIDALTSSDSASGQTANITNYGGLNIRFDGSTEATVTNMYGIKLNTPVNTTGASATNTYVLYSGANTLGTNNYGLYINGIDTDSYIQGNLGIGTSSISAKLHISETSGDIIRISGTNGLTKYILDTDGQLGTCAGPSSAAIISTIGQYHQSSGFDTGFAYYGRGAASTTMSIQHIGTNASPIALSVGFQGTQTGTVTGMRSLAWGSGTATTNIAVQGSSRDATSYSIGIDGVNAGSESTAPSEYRAAVRGVSSSNLDAVSYGGLFSAYWNDATITFNETYYGISASATGTTGLVKSTGDLIGANFAATGTNTSGDVIALRVPATANTGKVILGADSISGTEFLQVTGDTHLNGGLKLDNLTTTPVTGYVLQSTDVNGNADWVDPTTLASSNSFLTAQTTDATSTELLIGGNGGTRIPVASNSIQAFKITVTAIMSAANGDSPIASVGDSWCHTYKGVIKNISGTTSIVGTITEVTIAEDTNTDSWTATVSADDANDALTIDVTGNIDETVEWKAEIEVTENSY